MLSVILVRTVERAPTNLEATNARAVRNTLEGTVRQVKALINASFLWLLAVRTGILSKRPIFSEDGVTSCKEQYSPDILESTILFPLKTNSLNCVSNSATEEIVRSS